MNISGSEFDPLLVRIPVWVVVVMQGFEPGCFGVALAISRRMARLPRSETVVSGYSTHKNWRGHNGEWNLKTDGQKAMYLHFMNEDLESKKYVNGSYPQAITLMSNHPHEISHILDQKRYSDHMRRHHSRYGRFFNDSTVRSGEIAGDRPYTTLLGDSDSEMRAVMYVHANPLRAGIGDAERYYWSTHRLYAFGKREDWMRNIQLPKWYLDFGKNPEERQRRYRKLFAIYLKQYSKKQSFLEQPFFGPEKWMLEQQEAIKKSKKDKPPPDDE